METIKIPKAEYEDLINELNTLKDNHLLKKMNDLIDVIYEQKYGLYLGAYTEDLQEISVNSVKEWHSKGSVWDEV